MTEQKFTTLTQWLDWIESSHPVDRIELGLDRLRQVFQRMALKLDCSTKVIVGGTNGKGSTIAMLDQVLRDQGKSVGCFTSPHFIRYNERIRLNGAPVSDALIMRAFEAIEQAREGVPLTYFEYNTLAALHVFATEQPDVMLLEVGLGGRLDAINIVDADVSVVTTVAIDHIDWLGDDREQIGYEKAGIYRSGKPAVCGDPEPPEKLIGYATEIGAQLYLRGRDFNLQEQAASWSWQGQQANGNVQTLSGLPDLNLPIANAATVIQVLQLLDMLPDTERLRGSLASAVLTGRMQHICRDNTDYFLDVAHNPEAAGYLAKRLQDKPVSGATRLVIGMLADKDIEQVLELLQPAIDCWYPAGLSVARGQTGAELASKLARLNPAVTSAAAYGTVQEALEAVRNDLQPGDRVIVAGSFFTVAGALQLFDMEG